MYRSLKNYTGKNVVVTANGLTYSGVLVEMTETHILLRSDVGHRQILMGAVTGMELKESGKDAEPQNDRRLPPSPLFGL